MTGGTTGARSGASSGRNSSGGFGKRSGGSFGHSGKSDGTINDRKRSGGSSGSRSDARLDKNTGAQSDRSGNARFNRTTAAHFDKGFNARSKKNTDASANRRGAVDFDAKTASSGSKRDAGRGAKTPSARLAAYSSLMRCLKNDKYSNLEIDSAINRFRLDGAEKTLYTALVYGVIERALTLDFAINLVSAKPSDRLDDDVRTILRLGLYQIIFLDRIPESAAVNESVELAKAFRFSSASFVNATLRSYLRRFGKGSAGLFAEIDRVADEDERLRARYSVGNDVISILRGAEGGEISRLLQAMCEQPFPTLRVNTLKMTRDELISRLNYDGDKGRPTQLSPFGIRLKNHAVSAEIQELISTGYVYIQDEASQLAVMAASPSAGERVIDVCACPGGKSFAAALMMNNEGEVLSFDLHKSKLSLIEDGARRLGITIIRAEEKNGAERDPSLEGTADLVMVDAPCSGLGVIAKKPEIRYKRAEDISRLPEVQFSILSNASAYVKADGRLFYTTCTLAPDENDGVVRRFLEAHPEFEPLDFEVGGLKSADGKLTLRPDVNGTDGFFISGFRRR